MANIDSTASNTDRMREHLFLKHMRGSQQHEQEEDLSMCSNVVNFRLSVCLNGLEPQERKYIRAASSASSSSGPPRTGGAAVSQSAGASTLSSSPQTGAAIPHEKAAASQSDTCAAASAAENLKGHASHTPAGVESTTAVASGVVGEGSGIATLDEDKPTEQMSISAEEKQVVRREKGSEERLHEQKVNTKEKLAEDEKKKQGRDSGTEEQKCSSKTAEEGKGEDSRRDTNSGERPPLSVAEGASSSKRTQKAETFRRNSEGGEVATLKDVLLANPTDKCLVSDVDEQMLINIFFNSPVRITSIAIRSTVPPPEFEWKKKTGDEDDSAEEEMPEDGTVAEPKVIKVHSNNSNLDFSTVLDETPAQVITLTPQQLKGEERLPLRGSKFQRCSSLHLFIEKNQANAMHTFLNRICLFGYVNKIYVS